MAYVNTKNKQGFTLVELAIVLVIIGLIVASVLVGQDLIKAAELRATVRQLDQFQAAVNTFIGKYNQAPGDADTDKFGLGGLAGVGDADGIIEDATGSTSNAEYNNEIPNFWAHLTTTGKELLPGQYVGASATAGDNAEVGVTMPQVKASTANGWGVFTDGTKNYFIAGVVTNTTDDAYNTANIFVPLDSFNIDSKIDDGVPDAGTVQARGTATAAPDTAAAVSVGTASVTTGCVNTTPTPNEYLFEATNKNCNLRFDLSTF